MKLPFVVSRYLSARIKRLGIAGEAASPAREDNCFERRLWHETADRLSKLTREWFRQEGESQSFLCWYVVCFGIGVLLFFQSSGDARPLWPLLGAACGLMWAYASRQSMGMMRMALAVFATFAGFSSGVLRLQRVEAPVLQKTEIGTVTGYVESLEYRIGRSPQLVIAPVTLADLPPEHFPNRIRVTLRAGPSPAPGDFVSAKMRLMPLPQPVRPSGYDFARDSYFKGLGAVGTVLGKMEVVEATSPPPSGLLVNAAIDRARNALTKRIYEAVGPDAGGVAAALVTGKRGYIPQETNDALRAAGIYHIVSISGLHMVIAAGLVFWTARAILALFPPAALRWPIKKISAGIAMLGAIAYCLFSGADVATQRSLFMTLVMLGAILVERRVLSMRNLAIAALVLLIMNPEAILGPGFQMSFAAVAGLIALSRASRYFTISVHGNRVMRSIRWCLNWCLALTATTLVAGLATAPFAAYHFQTAVPFGLIGNALALPLVSFVVMPMGALGALLYPFSLDQSVWQIMGLATAFVVRASYWVASLDGSLLYFPAFGSGAVLMATLAVVLATILVSPLRYGALMPLTLSVVLASTPERYLVFVDRDGRAAAIRGIDGKLFMVGNANGFLAEQWLRADGDERSVDDETLKASGLCDGNGCVGQGVLTVALAKTPFASVEDCRRADIVISRFAVPPSCEAAIIIDRTSLTNNGAAAILRGSDGRLTVRHARESVHSWPWFLRPAVP